MCRLAAYIGPSLRLDRFLLERSHGLLAQAHAPRETLSATVNADGFGLGWYDAEERPATYRTTLPAWADPNLEPLGRSLERGLWMANVRSATDPLSNGYANTQPFHDERLLFLHNGFLAGFADSLRVRFRSAFEPSIESAIAGTTDSEYIFALLRQVVATDRVDLTVAVRTVLDRLAEWCGGGTALLNLVVTDGDRIVATRHAFNESCPSLYVCAHDGGHAVASEPLDDDGWQAVPPHHVAVLEPGSEIRLSAI